MNQYDVARLRDSATNEYERNHYVRKEDGTTYWIEGPEFDDYYVILPSTKLWDIEKFKNESNSSVGKMCEYGFSYNSGTNKHFLNVTDLQELIKSHI